MKLITGANGFIGQALVAVYGDEALAVSRRPDQSPQASAVAGKQITCDISRPELVGELITQLQAHNISEIIHAAAVTPWSPNPDFSIDLAMAQTLTEVCNRLHIPRFTFLSGWIVYDMQGAAPYGETTAVGPTTDYGKSKLAVETYFAHNLKHTILVNARLASVYGPGQISAGLIPNFVRMALQGEELTVASVKTRRDYLFIDDLADALHGLSTAKIEQNMNINFGSGKSVTVGDVAEAIQRISRSDYHKDVRINRPAETNEASPIDNQLDIQKAQSFGLLQQMTSLHDGLEAYMAWVNAQAQEKN